MCFYWQHINFRYEAVLFEFFMNAHNSSNLDNAKPNCAILGRHQRCDLAPSDSIRHRDQLFDFE